MIVSKFGSRKSMFLGSLSYAAILASYIYPRKNLLYLFSVLNGAGSAVLWTAQGTFLSENSSKNDIIKSSAVFWTIFQTSYFFGNFYIYFTWSGVTEISSNERIPLYMIFTGLTIVGCFGLFLTNDNNKQESLDKNDEDLTERLKIRSKIDAERLIVWDTITESLRDGSHFK